MLKTTTKGGRDEPAERLRVLWAALIQEWHQKQCSDCEATWMAVGPYHHDLIDRCDDCAQAEIDRFAAHTEEEFQRAMKGVR